MFAWTESVRERERIRVDQSRDFCLRGMAFRKTRGFVLATGAELIFLFLCAAVILILLILVLLEDSLEVIRLTILVQSFIFKYYCFRSHCILYELIGLRNLYTSTKTCAFFEPI